MKTFIVQYSRPGNRPAVSDWKEYTKEIKAETDKEAIEKFNHQPAPPGVTT